MSKRSGAAQTALNQMVIQQQRPGPVNKSSDPRKQPRYIYGVTGSHANLISGKYEYTIDMNDGMPVYSKNDDIYDVYLMYDATENGWYIVSRGSLTDTVEAYIECDGFPSYPETIYHNVWHIISDDDNRVFVKQPGVRISFTPPPIPFYAPYTDSVPYNPSRIHETLRDAPDNDVNDYGQYSDIFEGGKLKIKNRTTKRRIKNKRKYKKTRRR